MAIWHRGFISVFGLVAAEAATRTTIKPVPIGIHAIIDRYQAEQQAVWSAGPRLPVTLGPMLN
ncbi:hypothetical protein DPMN_021838 [Dreissena polymorpha]|uniref:Uncharacterized protein n=1 Tax=Dreissena polymorpha TaxID=45954 RepID=A0A9D3Y6D5_DREPO|nr:hypothetical protein DPMN_080853 [Dreissena polymorpha]KAH3897645.1 hypothetical protein DPMN_021838 [Dreissena polymorpha]